MPVEWHPDGWKWRNGCEKNRRDTWKRERCRAVLEQWWRSSADRYFKVVGRMRLGVRLDVSWAEVQCFFKQLLNVQEHTEKKTTTYRWKPANSNAIFVSCSFFLFHLNIFTSTPNQPPPHTTNNNPSDSSSNHNLLPATFNQYPPGIRTLWCAYSNVVRTLIHTYRPTTKKHTHSGLNNHRGPPAIRPKNRPLQTFIHTTMPAVSAFVSLCARSSKTKNILHHCPSLIHKSITILIRHYDSF